MDTLDTLGRRIRTTDELRGIVRTMKALSGVSIRQFEQAALALHAYAETVERGLQAFLHRHPGMARSGRSSRGGATGEAVAIVFGSDHGLCGRFNELVVARAAPEIRDASVLPGGIRVLAIGVQAASRLEAAGCTVDATVALPATAAGLVAMAEAILLRLDAWQGRRPLERVLLFHNGRTAARAADGGTQAPGAEALRRQLVPLDPDWLAELRRRRWPSRSLPSAGPAALFSALVRQHLFVLVFRGGAESLASEHAMRLAAMQAAERSIDEHLDEMRSRFRRLRQDSITAELLDVVAGAEASRPARGG